MQNVVFPVQFQFKIGTLANDFTATDANGKTLAYVRQKMFKLKEAVTVFRDESKSQVLCEIKADRIIDWSANYHFYDASGETFGSVRRKGMRSLWKAHYEVFDESGNHISNISEENPMAKVMDGLLGEIPIIGMFAGYFFHPKYLLSQASDGSPKMRLTKQAAMWEGKYQLDRMYDFDDVDEQ